ncbi:erlin (er lipid raft associated protein) [Anaeramoeba flamelloides]|uniref:Erlin (Er lipid raft associated protein) n=1 Tax=Anaeramoeba flamelloides TaxID=1746091 RepID=A0AAV7ZVY3_9EUKA|nr:erlin (er lipid raft associated protein) [Anaeramoeba flamelloides]KAJ6243020.1 erlin (er lipid raft associated protein) [Anaeramoeba flamelloides]|eukprot:Anaeramoba_flamelloidesa344169_224.p1 GENE.a344169_224~~a344169_224.p1  ORF type:complete len:335 (-),score=101.69 a344169_224:16-1020(-)
MIYFYISTVIILFSIIFTGVHVIPEGYVGVYYRGGKLLSETSDPGYHVKIPFITRHENIQVTIQTDEVKNIPCGTSGGVMIMFDKIEVVNKLNKEAVWKMIKNYTSNYDQLWIFQKIHHEINQFCSGKSLEQIYITDFENIDERLIESLEDSIQKWAPGLEIISIRVSKPRLPKTIMSSYEKIELERTNLKIAEQHQKVVQKEAETERYKATIEAQKVSEVSTIKMKMLVSQKESESEIAKIEDEIKFARDKSEADSEYYTKKKIAEGNNQLLTPEYLKLMLIENLAKTTKVYYGSEIDGVFKVDLTQIDELLDDKAEEIEKIAEEIESNSKKL